MATITSMLFKRQDQHRMHKLLTATYRQSSQASCPNDDERANSEEIDRCLHQRKLPYPKPAKDPSQNKDNTDKLISNDCTESTGPE
jgi:hypothetical protein